MEQDELEVWEAQTSAMVYVYQRDRDPRNPTGYRQVKVGGSGSKRLRITTADRVFNQEQVLEENIHLDPFSNGSLKRVDGGSNDGIMTDEDLTELLGLGEEAFEETVREMDNELTVRRLAEFVQNNGRVTQLEIVRSVIEDRWKVGGTQRTVREMIEAEELAGGEVVSG